MIFMVLEYDERTTRIVSKVEGSVQTLVDHTCRACMLLIPTPGPGSNLSPIIHMILYEF